MLKPIRDNIIVKPIEQETVTKGGILLPGSSLEKPYQGVVVARNETFFMPDGTQKQAETHIGDIVIYGKHHGTEIEYNHEKYLVISEEFILCKEKQSNE